MVPVLLRRGLLQASPKIVLGESQSVAGSTVPFRVYSLRQDDKYDPSQPKEGLPSAFSHGVSAEKALCGDLSERENDKNKDLCVVQQLGAQRILR